MTVAAFLAALLAGLFICASSGELYMWAMGRAGVFESAGVDSGTLAIVAEDITQYIFERNPSAAFDRVIVMDGLERPELNDREKAHMLDVRRLLRLAGIAGGCLAVICAAAGVYSARINAKINARRATGCGMLAGTGATMLAALIVIMAIRADFYNFFVALHKRLFTNDLWYMNPETDLLIRMMPSGFFLSMGMVVGAATLVLVLVILPVGLWLVLSNGRREARRAV
jgi:integral membrane protein (TIGR01906 family)